MEFAIIGVLAIALYFVLEHVDDDRGGNADLLGFRQNSDEL